MGTLDLPGLRGNQNSGARRMIRETAIGLGLMLGYTVLLVVIVMVLDDGGPAADGFRAFFGFRH